MRRRTPYALAALILFALALLFHSPAPAAAQRKGDKGGSCNGCYKRYERCQGGGEKETCYEQLVECLLGSGCPVTLPPAQ